MNDVSISAPRRPAAWQLAATSPVLRRRDTARARRLSLAGRSRSPRAHIVMLRGAPQFAAYATRWRFRPHRQAFRQLIHDTGRSISRHTHTFRAHDDSRPQDIAVMRCIIHSGILISTLHEGFRYLPSRRQFHMYRPTRYARCTTPRCSLLSNAHFAQRAGVSKTPPAVPLRAEYDDGTPFDSLAAPRAGRIFAARANRPGIFAERRAEVTFDARHRDTRPRGAQASFSRAPHGSMICR